MKLTGAILGAVASNIVIARTGLESRVASFLSDTPELTEASLAHLEGMLNESHGKSGATEGSSSGMFEELSRMINQTMTPAILTAHDASQEQLNAFATAFTLCLAPQEQTGSDGVVVYPQIEEKLEEHRQCRAKQVAAKTAEEDCLKDLEREKTVAKGVCDAVPGSDGSPPPLDNVGHVGCKHHGDYEGWLNSFSSQVKQLHDQFQDAKDGCGNATKLVTDMAPKCMAAMGLYDGNKSACDAIQLAADEMGCSSEVAAAHTCSLYDACYEAAKNNYLGQNESIAEAQVNRTAQWRTLKRMQCLLNEEAAGATHDGVDACREATIDTSHLDLDYPPLPPKTVCADLSVTKHGPEPCSSDWVKQYGSLASPAAPCTPCTVTTTTTWVLVFRQSRPYLWKKGELSLNSGDDSSENYAILNELESFRFYGQFEFKLVWPDTDWKPQVWRQRSNPVSEAAVTGYTAVSAPYTGRWHGLQKGGRNSLIDGTKGGNWWYAIGTTVDWRKGWMPGPAGGAARNGAKVKKVELYVRTSTYLAGDESWPLVFRQTYPFKFSDNQWTLNVGMPTSSNFAMLDELENFRSTDGKFEFKLVWPLSEAQDMLWKQSSNPVTMSTRGVEGYEVVSVPHPRKFGGLTNNLGRSTLLDGVANSGWWWFSVGAKQYYQKGYPGIYQPRMIVSAVELYVKHTPPR